MAEKKEHRTEKEVKIYSLATMVNECIIFLEEVDGTRLLPIWIGLAEGQSIAIKLSGLILPRPLTHDLMLAFIKNFGYDVEKIVVNDIKENTFYALIHLKKGKEKMQIDARPSDAVALAVRSGCPIFVDISIFDRCQVLNKPISEDEVKKFKEELKNLKPRDIFKELRDKGKSPPDDAPKEDKP